MKLYWIYGKYAEDFWITTAKDSGELFEKFAKECSQTIDWVRENATFSEIKNIDGYNVILEKV